MTDQIDEILNLPKLSDLVKEAEEEAKAKAKAEEEQKQNELQNMAHDAPSAAMQMAQALSDVKSLEIALANEVSLHKHDTEMDEISNFAFNNAKNLMDLAFNVDTKYAGSIAEPAVNMLKMALEARNSKVDTKLRLMRLQLEKERLDRSRPPEEGIVDDVSGGPSILEDRNKLIAALKKK